MFTFCLLSPFFSLWKRVTLSWENFNFFYDRTDIEYTPYNWSNEYLLITMVALSIISSLVIYLKTCWTI